MVPLYPKEGVLICFGNICYINVSRPLIISRPVPVWSVYLLHPQLHSLSLMVHLKIKHTSFFLSNPKKLLLVAKIALFEGYIVFFSCCSLTWVKLSYSHFEQNIINFREEWIKVWRNLQLVCWRFNYTCLNCLFSPKHLQSHKTCTVSSSTKEELVKSRYIVRAEEGFTVEQLTSTRIVEHFNIFTYLSFLM